jgi:hypothetical protein
MRAWENPSNRSRGAQGPARALSRSPSLGVANPELDLQERLHDVAEFRYMGLVDLARRLTMDELVAAASMVASYGAPTGLGPAEGRGEAFANGSNV